MKVTPILKVLAKYELTLLKFQKSKLVPISTFSLSIETF